MTIDNSGSVGVGTDSPGTKLHVYDAASDITARVETGKTDGTAALELENDAQTWQLSTAPDDKFVLKDVD